MKKEKLYIISITVNILGIIISLILGNVFNFFKFLPTYQKEAYNYSLFLSGLLFFWLISIIVLIIAKRKSFDLADEDTLEQFKNNYQLKNNVNFYSSFSLFLIIFIIGFILWMLLYDNDVEYCYFLCTIKEVIALSIVIPFFFSLMIILIRKIFKKKKVYYLK